MKQLTIIDKAFLLKKSALFRTLDLDYLLLLADKLNLISIEKGQKIFTCGSEANRLFIVIDGTVAIVDSQGRSIAELGLCECFGDEALFSQKTHFYESLALTRATLLSLHASHIFSLIEQVPSLALSLLEIYTEKLDYRPR